MPIVIRNELKIVGSLIYFLFLEFHAVHAYVDAYLDGFELFTASSADLVVFTCLHP